MSVTLKQIKSLKLDCLLVFIVLLTFLLFYTSYVAAPLQQFLLALDMAHHQEHTPYECIAMYCDVTTFLSCILLMRSSEIMKIIGTILLQYNGIILALI